MAVQRGRQTGLREESWNFQVGPLRLLALSIVSYLAVTDGQFMEWPSLSVSSVTWNHLFSHNYRPVVKIQDSRLLYYLNREIKTWLSINHIAAHSNILYGSYILKLKGHLLKKLVT